MTYDGKIIVVAVHDETHVGRMGMFMCKHVTRAGAEPYGIHSVPHPKLPGQRMEWLICSSCAMDEDALALLEKTHFNDSASILDVPISASEFEYVCVTCFNHIGAATVSRMRGIALDAIKGGKVN